MTETPSGANVPARHLRYWRLMRFLLKPILRGILGFKGEKAPVIDRPVLVLANHNTDFDPVLVAMSFEKHMYFVASEHIFRWGWITRLLGHMFAPIPLVKGQSDVRAVMEIARTLRGGKNICIFAEGNRSVDGITAAISPATGLLAKAGADLVTYRLEGGYFTQPRWSHSLRKGQMKGYVVGHYTAEQLKTMSQDEVNEIINRDLHEDAYARQMASPVHFRGRNIAEYLETALYLCPTCQAVGNLHSKGGHLSCTCGLDATYTTLGFLEGIDPVFRTVAKWYAWQLAQTDALIDRAADGPIFADASQSLYHIIPCKSATLLAQGDLSMTREALSVAGHVFPLADLSAMAIVGRMTLTFSTTDGEHYEIKSETPRSGYKYLNAFEALRKYPREVDA